MPFIDWSDSEGILELLIESVRDARNECGDDPVRARFLSELLRQLRKDIEQSSDVTDIAHRLKRIYDSLDKQFANDPVAIHVRDCIEALDLVEKHRDAQ